MMNQYKIEVVVEGKVSKYMVINQTGGIHSKWDTFTGAAQVVRDLNNMIFRMNKKKVG